MKRLVVAVLSVEKEAIPVSVMEPALQSKVA